MVGPPQLAAQRRSSAVDRTDLRWTITPSSQSSSRATAAAKHIDGQGVPLVAFICIKRLQADAILSVGSPQPEASTSALPADTATSSGLPSSSRSTGRSPRRSTPTLSSDSALDAGDEYEGAAAGFGGAYDDLGLSSDDEVESVMPVYLSQKHGANLHLFQYPVTERVEVPEAAAELGGKINARWKAGVRRFELEVRARRGERYITLGVATDIIACCLPFPRSRSTLDQRSMTANAAPSLAREPSCSRRRRLPCSLLRRLPLPEEPTRSPRRSAVRPTRLASSRQCSRTSSCGARLYPVRRSIWQARSEQVRR